MGMGYFHRKNKDYHDPLVSPSRPYHRDVWGWFRLLLIITFLLLDLLGVLLLFFPGLLYQVPRVDVGAQILIFPTQAGKLLQSAGAAPSVTPSLKPTLTPTETQGATPGATPTRPSSTPSANGSSVMTVTGPGLYVEALRTDPQPPRRNQDIYFYVTFLNSTGAAQTLSWDVLVYRAGNLNQYFGQSLPVGKGDSIGTGTSELRSAGPYKLFGGGGCQDIVVGIARMDGNKPTALINQPDGKPFFQAITLCP